MSCCNSFGQCTHGANCPVRATPTPSACLKANQCLSQTGDCHCDAAVIADAPDVLYSQIIGWLSVMTVVTLVWAVGLIWVAFSIVIGPTVALVQDWIATAVQYVISILPMAPFF